MGYTYNIDPEARLILEDWHGEVTMGEILECYEAEQRDARFSFAFDGLADLSDATILASFGQLRTIALSQGFTGKWVFVAPHDGAYGVARMYMAAAGDAREINVFRTRDEAMAWLRDADAGRG